MVGTRNHIKALKWWCHVSFIAIEEDVEGRADMTQASQVPKIVTIRAANFKFKGRTGSTIGWNINQLRAAPLIMAPKVKFNIGIVIWESSSEVY